MTRHVHLDPLGGVAGDMFAAALLDAVPEHAGDVVAAVRVLTGIEARAMPHKDAVFVGTRFNAEPPCEAAHHPHHAHEPGQHPHAPAAHAHVHWHDIRARIAAAGLHAGVTRHAIGIFAALAEAEARVHGVEVDDVTFHEVGALDSIADIVAAAVLIEACGDARWSLAALPLGGGRVITEHGPMPVPAPATALLLEGFAFVDDGIPGERVTPTGAAILRYLQPRLAPMRGGLRLARAGTGFGTRLLPGISNSLRVLVFDPPETEQPHAGPASAEHRTLAVIEFEVDDQTGEDLAVGLDALRTMDGVHDVLQMPVFGKKGRLATHIRVLARPEVRQEACDACFRETTTIGLRVSEVEGRALPRRLETVGVDGAAVGVKIVARPDGGRTAKAECDHALRVPGHAGRVALRREAERRALEQAGS